MKHTFVEVTKNEAPFQTLFFLVPVSPEEAVEDMRRRIGERGLLTTIDGETVKASHLNLEGILDRGETGKPRLSNSSLFDVDGSIVVPGNGETRRYRAH